jgi:hypothetical protein
VERLVELDLAVEAPAVVTAGPQTLVDVLVGVGVAMASIGRQRTLARYELSLAAVRDPALQATLAAGGDTIRELGTAALSRLGAADPTAASAELAAVLDGLVFTALVRGPHDPPALAAWLRPPLERWLGALIR